MELIIVAWIVFMWLILILPGIISERKKKGREITEYEELADQMTQVRFRAEEMAKRFGRRALTREELKELEELDEDRRSILAKFRRIFKRDNEERR